MAIAKAQITLGAKKMIEICTIVNDWSQYEQMKNSFIAAGFHEYRCRFRAFDNSIRNDHEPYGCINDILFKSTAKYVIFCHQDIRLDQGGGYEELVQALETLSRSDPTWAVAGNAGGDRHLDLAMCVAGPDAIWRTRGLPRSVVTLDENFLVISVEARLGCSDLCGFHLYGSDLCLNALKKGRACYVIDFFLTHLSAGNIDSDEFRDCCVNFQSNWEQYFTIGLIRTPCTFFSISRFRLLRRVIQRQRLIDILAKAGCTCVPFGKELLMLPLIIKLLVNWRRSWFPPPSPLSYPREHWIEKCP